MKIAICYLTNTKKDQTVSNEIYKSLENVVKNNSNNKHTYDIFRVINDNNQREDEDNTYYFTWEQLRKKYNHENRVFYKDYMGVCHLPLFYIKEKQPNYDYYIFYEDDLYFTGFDNNINPFDQFPISDFDIIFTYGRSYNPNWFWISKFKHNLPEGWYGFEGLLNCYIISNKSLEDLQKFCCDGQWYGHHELMINAFFENQKNIYRVGSLNRTFKSRIFLEANDLVIYLMKYDENIENTFIHPIKNIDMLTKVKMNIPGVK